MNRLDSYINAPLRIVVIGGGTGNSTVLSGLKPWIKEGLATIVNTFDDGGGTGKLRAEYGGIAVGDLRQCARAMSDLSPDALAGLEGRFETGSGKSGMNMQGQTVGNLMLERYHKLFAGDAERIIAAYSDLYQIRGLVLPVSNDNRQLRIITKSGQIIDGEHAAEETTIASLKDAQIGFDRPAEIGDLAEAAISQADMVVIAPGDLYTSIGPNLVVEDMAEVLENAKMVIMVANLMNRNRHTADFTVLDYAREYDRLAGRRIIKRVLYNNAKLSPASLRRQVEDYGSAQVEPNRLGLEKAGYAPLGADLLCPKKIHLDPNDALASSRSSIRHDPEKLAKAIMGVYFSDIS